MNKLLTFSFILISTTIFAQEMSQDTLIQPLKVEGDFRIEELSDKFAKQNKNKRIDGYRIQLFSGSKGSANNMKKEFVRSFPHIPSELVFETPAYKLQAANCITELEAQKVLQEIRTVFPGAFVVQTKIKTPTFELKEEK